MNFNEFLDIVIDRQGDAHDIYDEIMQGFKMFDYGKLDSMQWTHKLSL